MSRTHPSFLRIAAALALCACAEGAPAITEPPQLKPGSKGNVDTDSRARWAWSSTVGTDAVVAGIVGDGLDVNGGTSGAPSTYQGDVCGVHAKIFFHDPDFSQSGDAVFDPDMHYSASACGVRRTLRFDMDGDGTAESPAAAFTNARDVAGLAVGESRPQPMQFTVGLPDCERLIFADGAGTSAVRATRLPDVGNAGQWLVESEGTHTAACAIWRKGRYETTTLHRLPFSVTITEVPYAP